MAALLLVAHGSRRVSSNNEIRILAEKVREHDAGRRYEDVRCAFLELAEPSIPDGIEECIQAGASSVKVLPYFLSAGRHVIEDIPREVEGKQREHPEVRIELVPYLGLAESMPELLLAMAG
ncbi:MAG: CbiX/SirB N-terminal domain-containing protein [Gammaproteobacteria bacterium]|nr:CbiX/SirB N-terminal domain-containing protein [Gammaproteobacteria bacterium]MCP5135694.1 CbiX/SirB N-terminal domain-containing protein [Gammaproteobacteria bacterium]